MHRFNILLLDASDLASLTHSDKNQATGYASQHIWCLSQATIYWESAAGRASGVKMGG